MRPARKPAWPAFIRGARAAAANLVLGACLIVPASEAQPTTTAPAVEGIEARALTRARTALWGQVAALPLADDLTVGHWAARDAALDRAVRLWVRTRPRYGAVRSFSDQSREVDLRIEPEQLLGRLIELQAAFPTAAPELNEIRLRAAAQAWPVLWASGTAGHDEPSPAGQPRGWEDVSSRGIELARAAAKAAAIAKLLDAAAELKLNTARVLRAFLDSEPDIRRRVREFLNSAADVRIKLAGDQVAEAEATIDAAELAAGLTDIARSLRQPEYRSEDFREMILLSRGRRLSAVAYAVPPASEQTEWPAAARWSGAANWANETATASGRYKSAAGGDDPEPLRLEGARQNGIAALRRLLRELPVRGGLTVGAVLGYDHAAARDFETFLEAARAIGPPITGSDGATEVRVELPLRRLWLIVGDHADKERGTRAPSSAPADDRGDGEKGDKGP